MQRHVLAIIVFMSILILQGCSTSYEIKPVPFKMPTAFPNVQNIASAQIAAKSFNDEAEAKEAFGFDILGAGMLPVQIVFDNQGTHPLEIDPEQTFLEDDQGKVWQILRSDIAYERATKYSQSKNLVKEGAYDGLLGAAAGSIIGAAIGIVTGENVLQSAGKGAAVGAAAGATIGGAQGVGDNQPQRAISNDLKEKSLQNKAIGPSSLAHGFIFFPGEAKMGKQLRLRLLEKDTGTVYIVKFPL